MTRAGTWRHEISIQVAYEFVACAAHLLLRRGALLGACAFNPLDRGSAVYSLRSAGWFNRVSMRQQGLTSKPRGFDLSGSTALIATTPSSGAGSCTAARCVTRPVTGLGDATDVPLEEALTYGCADAAGVRASCVKAEARS